jgi:2-(1,2-epoxy-1,2-dihydrophenyl)acetyl-CoA isomerase
MDRDDVVGYSVEAGVATIVLRQPSLTTLGKEALLGAVTSAAEDGAVRAVVLTGTGRVFCAGQDLDEHAEALRADPSTAFDTLARHYNPIVASLASAPKPVIAAVNGTAAGAGLSLALAADLRVAAAGARFATAFTAIGLSFDSGLSVTLARAVGSARASELILLGEPFTAEQGLAWGLVGRVVPAEEVLAEAGRLAARLAAGPTAAYAAAKAALAAAGPPLAEVLEAERAAQVDLGRSSEHRAAVEAFVEQRRRRAAGQA